MPLVCSTRTRVQALTSLLIGGPASLALTACAPSPDGAGVHELALEVESSGVTAAGVLDAATTAPPDAGAPPGEAVNSSGPRRLADESCGRATVTHDDDGITVLFADYAFELTPGDFVESANCDELFDRVFEAGKAYAIQSYVVEGSSQLPASGALSVATWPYVFGQGPGKDAEGRAFDRAIRLKGPHEGDFRLEASFLDAELQFAPCTGTPLLGLYVGLVLQTRGEPRGGGSARITKLGRIKFKERSCAPEP